MGIRLFTEALVKFTLGVLIVGLLLFLPAGTLYYTGGWLFMALLFIPMFAAGLVMLVKKPSLLKSRLNAKEKQAGQQNVIRLSALMFLTGFILAGLDFRFGWTSMPTWMPPAASALFLFAYALYAEVFRENVWLSRTISVQDGQKVVDTGLYAVVRHPMYAVTLILFLCMPIILGSLPALIAFLLYPAIIIRRIESEEKTLLAELPGYDRYMKKVKYRLIPLIW